MSAQGWYRDPFGVHEQRWFSDGRPTALVRDGAAEAHDAPPSPTCEGALTEAATPEMADGDDLQRADVPGKERNYTRAALDAMTQSGWNFQ